MLNIFTVAFFGHRDVLDSFSLEQQLEKEITKLISQKQYVEFLVGRNGEFDKIVSRVIRKIKREITDDNSSLILILPYLTAEYTKNVNQFDNYYDEVEICEASSLSHPKAALQIRNRKMVDRADLIITYVEKNEGGAYKTVKYAKENNKQIINLAFAGG